MFTTTEENEVALSLFCDFGIFSQDQFIEKRGRQIFSKIVSASKVTRQRALEKNNAHLDRSCCWQHLQGRIQDFFKEGVVILRIQGKRSKAKGTGEGKGWEWGRARVMFEYIWQSQSWNIYYKLLVIGQVKSDSFGVTKAKLSYKYGLLRTIWFKHFVIDTII